MATYKNITIWDFYKKSNNVSTCNICNRAIKCSGGSTSGMRYHLKSLHNIDIDNMTEKVMEMVTAMKKDHGVMKFLTERRPDIFELIARLAAEDGLSYNIIAKSTTLNYLFGKLKYASLPDSPTTISKIVIDYKEKILIEYSKEIEKMKLEMFSLSITIDEWTSVSNKRYLNVILHSFNKIWNLGMCRIVGSATAENLINLLQDRIKPLGLSFKDRILTSITSEGASIMKSLGRMPKLNHQLCFAHAIQLAVIKALYDRDYVVDNDHHGQESDSNNQEECYESIYQLNPAIINFQDLINKIRKTIKTFKNSSLSSEKLSHYITEENLKDKKLILDVKTRWNSLCDMLGSFLSFVDPIRKALIDLKKDITFSDREVAFTTEIYKTLLPVKSTVEVLCRRDTDLYRADLAFMFLLDELTSLNSDFASIIKNELLIRINDRRTVNSEILLYLNVKMDTPQKYGIFFSMTMPEIEKAILDNFTFLFSNDLDENSNQYDNLHEEDSLLYSYNERLENALKQNSIMSNTKKMKYTTFSEILHDELVMLTRGGDMGKYLKQVKEIILNIKPTSVDCERAFSIANIFCSKLRNKLGDDSIDALCFLKDYFKEKNINK